MILTFAQTRQPVVGAETPPGSNPFAVLSRAPYSARRVSARSTRGA